MSDLTGELIDNRYLLKRVVAAGGMATIYFALDLRLDRPVAVKIMHPHLANDEDFVGRFIREAKAAAALAHPNIVAIQDQGWNEGGVPAVFIVMEYIEGFTLRDVITEQGALGVNESLRYFTPVLSAMSAAHKAGILHRDIKPENILISKDGRVKVADFGLAKGAQLGKTLTVESSVILGSVSYLSPEQVERGLSDMRSDVYSLGVVLFEMLTGKKPFDGESPIQIAYMHVNENVAAPSTLNPAIPSELDEIVLKATANNPDKRFKDAGEMHEQALAVLTKLDPKRRQMSLELDIPIPRGKSPKGKREKRDKFDIIKNITTQLDLKRGNAMRDTSGSAKGKRKVSTRVKRNRAIALLVVLLIIATSWYGISVLGNKIVIPSLAGMSQTQATNTVAELGLKIGQIQEVFSEDVPKGKVITSNPPGGGRIEVAGEVLLIVSKGKDRIEVPGLIGLTVEEAAATLKSKNLKIGRVSEKYNYTLEAGLIIDGNPPSGSRVRKDSSVDLIISKGPEQVELTNFVGKTSDQAQSELTSAGLIVNSNYEYSETVPIGTVISQTPNDVSTIGKGEKIELVISKGPSEIFIPNVYSLSKLAATKILEDLGFKVEFKYIANKKTVTDMVPKSGTAVTPGSTVTITLG
ncbi:MAG: Stk1 family PASTA domain-containing Ser/Thr kinase [Actinobacteria bacterium]|nr:Stk1 family PASTA domain-containing Ser/Thr kinase [Actinomycetota bacterium]MDA2981244.1 Stk1 family PASTA domain-containing Ser/Thr kinase [Actinomycetota bacterium]MDA2996166.1 Stk1 family PASTA domain-containing Ser/Thr kinase [Actinomycetota bacterium]